MATRVHDLISATSGSAKNDATRATRERDVANTLLSDPVFRDWAGDAMVAHSFFGEGRELTPYQQGIRGGVVRLFEKLAEVSDNGADFIAEVFRTKLVNKEK